jgi:type VI protein secretion system component VasK
MRVRHIWTVVLAWVLGLAAGAAMAFWLGPQLQCANDLECARVADRWWHLPMALLVALAPGVTATVLWRRSRRPAL